MRVTEGFPGKHLRLVPNPEHSEKESLSTNAVIAKIRELVRKNQEDEIGELVGRWADRQIEQRTKLDATCEKNPWGGRSLDIARFEVQMELDRAKIYEAMGDLVSAYNACNDAQIIAEQEELGEVIIKACTRQLDAYRRQLASQGISVD